MMVLTLEYYAYTVLANSFLSWIDSMLVLYLPYKNPDKDSLTLTELTLHCQGLIVDFATFTSLFDSHFFKPMNTSNDVF